MLLELLLVARVTIAYLSYYWVTRVTIGLLELLLGH